MKKMTIVASMLTVVSVSAIAQTYDNGMSLSRPTQTTGNLGWASGQAQNELELEPLGSSTAPTLTTLIASYRDTELNRMIVAAKDDAQAFVATNGEVRGATLGHALNTIRSLTRTNASDMQLAEEILVVTQNK